MHSCIYKGNISHSRKGTAANAFRYSLFMLLLDLDETDTVFAGRWFWSTRRPAPARFKREDHYGDPAQPLAEAIRDLVEKQTGSRPSGRVQLLTHLSYFGYCFNPLSVYYCYDADEQLQDVVLEVSNTPWGEQHCYVLGSEANESDRRHRYSFAKDFHVSPFLPMDMQYRCRLTPPADTLYVALDNYRDDVKIFGSHLALERREITGRALAATLLRDPLMTFRVVALIHWQAMKLWLKRATYYGHPAKNSNTTTTQGSGEGIKHHG
ncbi:MAG: DUF1365 domain-containing protein [Gammaproteobacteria bacterium]|nr:DUF1365 domain-containing protein [Gammaproteobacteria bacterium]